MNKQFTQNQIVDEITMEEATQIAGGFSFTYYTSTSTAEQEEAPSHSGIVSFDLDTYK